jgi:hypothetical protein
MYFALAAAATATATATATAIAITITTTTNTNSSTIITCKSLHSFVSSVAQQVQWYTNHQPFSQEVMMWQNHYIEEAAEFQCDGCACLDWYSAFEANRN